MRSLISYLLLPLWLFAQQGALLHEISHIDVGAPTAPLHRHHPGGKPCDLCLAFAAVAGPAAQIATPVFALLDLVEHHAIVALPAGFEIAAPAPRSRGPPFVP
ncbi:MAG: hypothetical protein KGL18_02675 [Burkholderiales bacterium]|nr:hypothetical protein [Burkholderiales bacterium]MDE1927620.1 hypothetical protein [Burkholderiales bacterium]MDE2160743.1 hypothetical protein [Burkholderiales bacterium]MDE2501870.1 hypothetical protein [Burkholderiales bacterium]